MVLVFTSVWVEVFRRTEPMDLTAVCDFDEVVTCLPILQEVLQGFRDERAYNLARESMLALPSVEVPLTWPVCQLGVDLYRQARRMGLTIRSSADCLIAACALRHGLTVLCRDRDFPALAKVSPLQVRVA